MNTQLALIDVKDIEVAPRPSKRAAKKSDSNNPWWKLSEEEKQRGIQGVQAIKAILNQTSGSEDLFLAKAS